MTTLIAATGVGGFLFLAALSVLGFPSRRTFLDALLFAAKHVARFTWSFQIAMESAIYNFRKANAEIAVPALLRKPSHPFSIVQSQVKYTVTSR